MSDASPFDKVDLDDGDRARVSYLSKGELSETEARRIVKFAKLPRSERSPELLTASNASDDASDPCKGETRYGTSTVDETVCADIRRRMRQAERPTQVTQEYPDLHPSAIFRHGEGRCSCDTDEPATTSPRVGKSECKDMREAFRNGATEADITADFQRSTNAVRKHVFGDCQHTREGNDLGLSAFDRITCGHLRKTVRNNDELNINDVAVAFGVSQSTAWRHFRGACSHETDTPPVTPHEVTPKECRKYRRMYDDSNLTYPELADKVDRSDYCVRYHVSGMCNCQDDDEV